MGCCSTGTRSPTRPNNRREEILLKIPGAAVHLMSENEAVELVKGDLIILRVIEGNSVLATVMQIGPEHLQWPLTKDEPVVKLDQLHYLFSLPDEDGRFLNYGVSFARTDIRLDSLDLFLKENACFSAAPNAKSLPVAPSSEAYWRDYAPKIEDYNGVLAKAIAGGTGQIVKGIFSCSNAYSNQVFKGAELIRPQAVHRNAGVSQGEYGGSERDRANRNQGSINKSIRRVRRLSGMMEKMSRSLLNAVLSVTGSVAVPFVRSKAGKSLLASAPGEVILATLDAVNMVMDAVEAAERKTLAATSNVVAGAVSKRFGESAGETTEDVFATAGHAFGTAWNIFKIRKAVNPSSSAILKNALKKRA